MYSNGSIRDLVLGYAAEVVSDERMSRFLREVYDGGMSFLDVLEMTMAMADSGARADLSDISGPTVDKHSTGGVGDKTTIIVAPLAAACGLKFAKMSGRTLGHTGGTLNKLESIPGFRTDLSGSEFSNQVNSIGAAVIGQSAELAPADKKIYALRDRTGTVASIPLIAASVMSKKIAAGAANIVLDVKTGNGAFMKTETEARKLAETCVRLGDAAGRNTRALVTRMDRPLGRAVGNELEVLEAIDVLRGGGPEDVRELSTSLVATLLVMSGLSPAEEHARRIAEETLTDGTALEKLKAMVAAQGGDANVIDQPETMPRPPEAVKTLSAKTGFIFNMDTERIGWALKRTGGAVFQKKTGDAISAGEPIARVFGTAMDACVEASREILESVEIADSRPPAQELVLGYI